MWQKNELHSLVNEAVMVAAGLLEYSLKLFWSVEVSVRNRK